MNKKIEELAELLGAVKLGQRENFIEMIKEKIEDEQAKSTQSENVKGALRAYYKVIEMLENYSED